MKKALFLVLIVSMLFMGIKGDVFAEERSKQQEYKIDKEERSGKKQINKMNQEERKNLIKQLKFDEKN